MTSETQIDWTAARQFLGRRLAGKLLREDRATLDDLTQEALVRLIRATRREDIENVEALMVTIAERTVIDFLRSRKIWQKGPVVDPEENLNLPQLVYVPDGEDAPSDERIRFVVLEFFQERNTGCLELARHYFENRNWLEVARILDRPHTAIRQQWTRCVAVLRAAVRDDATWAWEWA